MTKFEHGNTVFILAVSSDEEMATSLLTSVFSDLTTSDSQEWTCKYNGVDIKAYIKYPGCDVLRRTPPFADFTLVQVSKGHEDEQDVLNYASTRGDSRAIYLMCEDKRNVLATVQNQTTTGFLEILTKYTSDLKEWPQVEDGEQDLYMEERREWVQGEHFFRVGSKIKKLPKLLNEFKAGLDKYEAPEQGKSKNEGRFEIAPEDGESNGLGFVLNMFSGEEFDKQNPKLPLTVRDNLATGCIELFCKSEEGADIVINMLESAKMMLMSMGVEMKKLFEKAIYVTFSKEGKSVWVDVTFNGNYGEELVYIIRSLLLDRFKFSLNGSARVQTNINLKDLWDKPCIDKILDGLALLTISDSGEILNLRTIFHILKDVVYPLFKASDSQKKNHILISHGALILSCFENLVFDVKFNSQDMKLFVKDAIAAARGMEEEEFDAFILQSEGMLNEQMLPMAMGMLEQFKPFFAAFIPGLKELDLEKICIEGLSPEIRTEFKLNVLLPGLTEFVEKHITN
jgi:hypothetical protein